MLNKKRFFALLAFSAWWIIWFCLIVGVPLKIGKHKVYSADEGCGTSEYENYDIKTVQRLDFGNYADYLFTGHPHPGPMGTTFDHMNKRFAAEGNAGKFPLIGAMKNAIRFGSVENIGHFFGPVNPVTYPHDPAKMSSFIKLLAEEIGADAVGIADLRPDPLKFFFSTDVGRNPLQIKPEENTYAIVFLHEEPPSNHPLLDDETGFNKYPEDFIHYYTKVQLRYWADDFIPSQVAEFIRSLGYHAIAHNNFALRQPAVAVKAGLGEMNRLGCVMTVKWGPNIGIGAVTTDMPLIPDEPIDIGVQDCCDMCTRCYDYCPMSAIPIKKSYYMGVSKWKTNTWRCRRSSLVGVPSLQDWNCGVCRDVCPWVKPTNFVNVVGRTIVSRSHIGRKILVKLDDWLYSKDNKNGWKDWIAFRKERVKRSFAKYPDLSQEWMTLGAKDPSVRQKVGRAAHKAGGIANSVKYIRGPDGNIMFPFYTDEQIDKDPTFGKWPTWYDMWGRKIAGYQDGEKGAPGLDCTPALQALGGAFVSGIGGNSQLAAGIKEPLTQPFFHAYQLVDPLVGAYDNN